MKSVFRFTTGAVCLCLLSQLSFSKPSDIQWVDGVDVNPVIKEPGLTDANRAYYPFVLFDASANKWRAWFDASSGADVGYAESEGPDGLVWGNYALCDGFDTGVQSKVHVIQLGENSFRMWYMADARTTGYQINTAVSSDGVTWTEDTPITGMAGDDMVTFGPIERIAVVQDDDGSFVAYCRCEEFFLDAAIEFFDQGKFLFRYESTDGVAWTWTGYTGVGDFAGYEGFEFSSVVKHPDLENTWYAWGNNQNSAGPIASFVSTDGGIIFDLDEEIINVIGEAGTQSYNQERNFHPSATYLGNGDWVMFRSVSHDPHATGIAWGTEPGLVGSSVPSWELY